jgi:hypothetical protein
METLNPTDRLAPVKNAETTARLYRRLVLLVGLQILVSFARFPAILQERSIVALAIQLVGLVVALGVYVATAVTAYQLTRHLGESLPVLWAIAMFIPCINLITLLVISSRAQTWCRQYGIKVGLLGPTKQSIEDLRRRLLSSDFD